MFFFHSATYNHQMSLSQLQKLYPSSIGKCAMVFVPPLACEKRRNIGVFLTPVRNFTNARSIQSTFYQCRMIDDNQKRFILHLAIETELFHSASANPCMM
jgi:hypothetical protein